jgi:hypothetical protein
MYDYGFESSDYKVVVVMCQGTSMHRVKRLQNARAVAHCVYCLYAYDDIIDLGKSVL